jgi:hypothetical protein
MVLCQKSLLRDRVRVKFQEVIHRDDGRGQHHDENEDSDVEWEGGQ